MLGFDWKQELLNVKGPVLLLCCGCKVGRGMDLRG